MFVSRLVNLLTTPRRFVILFAASYVLAAALVMWGALHVRASKQLFVADGFGYYAYLPALWSYHDLSFERIYSEPEAREMGKGYAAGHYRTPLGRLENPFPIGPAVVWTPGYLLGRAVVSACADGPSARPLGPGTQAAVWIWALLLNLAGVLLAYDLLCRKFGCKVGGQALLLGFWGTPLVAYCLVEPSFSHGVAFSLVTAFVWCIERLRRGPSSLGYAIGSGLLLGLAIAARPNLAVVVLYAGVLINKDRPLKYSHLVAMGTTTVVGALPQFLNWKWMYGAFLPRLTNTSWGHMEWGRHAGELLFSLNHGLFTWTPLWLFALVGLFLYTQTDRRLVWLSVAILAIHWCVNSSNPNWHGDGAFGQRKFVDISILFLLGLGSLLSAAERWSRSGRAALNACVFLMVLQNLSLMARYYTHRIPQSGPLNLIQLFFY